MENKVVLFGTASCHKTVFYQSYLNEKGITFEFLDVKKDEEAAKVLRSLYESVKLNFPTLLVGGKKLRNPSIKDLDKWLEKKGLKRGTKNLS